MIVVADASPVCYLIVIGEIELLPKLLYPAEAKRKGISRLDTCVWIRVPLFGFWGG